LKGFQDFFSVDSKQAQGLIFLMILLVVLIFTPLGYRWLSKTLISLEDSTDAMRLESYFHQLQAVSPSDQVAADVPGLEIIPALCDPNVASTAELTAIGMPVWLASRLINYRAAGGQFYEKADMMRLYGMTEEMYANIEPWLHFPKRKNVDPASFGKSEKSNSSAPIPISGGLASTTEEEVPKLENQVPNASLRIELNRADSLELQQLRGIGPVLSARIITFRERLGGFYTLDQLREVYGLRAEVIDAILPYLYLDDTSFEPKLQVNTQDLEAIAAHPYLSFRDARAIVNYRRQHGPFGSTDDLRKIIALPDTTLLKIIPYLNFSLENEDSKY
jgi:DNA uptake protein ComE-like DNA-binding protein